jgi:hypothetical protein
VPVATVTGVLATTHPLDKYGGRFRASLLDLEEMRDAFLSGAMSSSMNHDPAQTFEAKPVNAWIEEMSDSEHCLKVTYEVDAVIQERFQEALLAAGAPGALSYARTVGFGELRRPGPVTMLIAGEASNFSQAEIADAAVLLPAEDSIDLAELVEFAADDACRIVVVVAEHHSILRDYGPAAVGALLYPTLRALWKTGRWIRVQLQFRRDDGSRLEAIVATDDLARLRGALESSNDLDGAWRQGGNIRVIYNHDQSSWQPPS